MGIFSLLGSLLGVEVDTLIQRVRESAVAFAAIGLFALICLTFLLVALYTVLNNWVGPIWSPLIIAGGALLIAIVLFIALQIQEAALKRRTEERRKEAESTALIASAAINALPELLASPAVRDVGLPILLYAGFLLLSRSKPKPEK
jgi:Putative Actinobacterial Holin-X, holin superfamily III